MSSIVSHPTTTSSSSEVALNQTNPKWKIYTESFAKNATFAGTVSPHDLESAIEELDMLYKSKSPMLKRIGHASLLQRRAISIIQLTTSTCLPKSHARDEGHTGALRHPNRLSELESVIFAEANKMLDMTGAGYQDHICLVYLETNEAVAGVVTFVAKLGVSLGIHELMQLAWN